MKRIPDVRRRLIDRLAGLTGGYAACARVGGAHAGQPTAGQPTEGQNGEDRRGSTLVVVIALLGALLLLGMLALTLSQGEQLSSEYWADAAKDPQPDFDPDVYFDIVLRQLIIGPSTSEKQSALSGGRWSLLANMLGDDMNPFNGPGMNVVWNTTSGQCDVDTNLDRTPDGNTTSGLLEVNDSPSAQGSVRDLTTFPKPDVNFTYPDWNNLFVQYDAMAPTSSHATDPYTQANNGDLPFRMITPSFHRPVLLRGLGSSDWYRDAATKNRVLRVHKLHRAVDDKGNVTSDNRVYDTGDSWMADGLSGPFPLDTGAQGPWTGDVVTTSGSATYTGLDVDTDGDGVKDAVYLDLGLPAEPIGAGQFRVPLVAISIKDADALFNLNAHGSVYGSSAFGALQQNPYGGARASNAGADGVVGTGDDTLSSVVQFISRSNTGAMPHEVNPQWGLAMAPPASGSPSLKTHNFFFGHDPAQYQELANMEWWFLMMGAPVYGSTATDIDELIYGRYSGLNERSQLLAAVSAATKDPRSFPLPGRTGFDDNNNQTLGVGTYRPFDAYGVGQVVMRGSLGRTKRAGYYGQVQFRKYDNHGVNAQNGYWLLHNVMLGAFSGLPLSQQLMANGVALNLTDEPIESWLDPRLGVNNNDSVFAASEAEGTQLSATDIAAAGVSSRVEKLAPINFAPSAEVVRKLYTPVSWDLKSFGRTHFNTASLDSRRGWEFNTNPAYNRVMFPPSVPTANLSAGAQQPFRDELRDLLMLEANDLAKLRDLQRRLSVNHVLERDPNNNRLRFRPLTIHPQMNGAGLNQPISQILGSFRPTVPEQLQGLSGPQLAAAQEWLARRDRQKLCRDIYVILYLLCGGNDGVNYLSDNSAQTLYGYAGQYGSPPPTLPPKGDQCRMMAQFAVNLVDQMDGDDIVTRFEYDVNLSNGWDLGDDPFSTGDDTAQAASGNERRFAYGVEEQQLVFSEANVIWAPRYAVAGVGADQSDTEWDDSNTKNWFFLEMQNISPRNVDLGGQAWQVAVLPNLPGVRKPDGTSYPPPSVGSPIVGEERRLMLTSGVVKAANPGTLPVDLPVVSVKTDSEYDIDSMTTNPRASNFVLNPHKNNPTGTNPTETKFPIAPRSAAVGITDGISYDLVTTTNNYSVNHGLVLTAGDVDGDGTQIISGMSTPAGMDLLHIDTAGDPDAIDASLHRVLTVTLELRRRMNPYRQMPVQNTAGNALAHKDQSNDNPWIVVDTIDVPVNVFKLEVGNDYDEIRPKLEAMKSRERGEVLNRLDIIDWNKAGDPEDWLTYVNDSIGQRNYNNTGVNPTPAQFGLSQCRYDRQFGTLAELFQIPLYGPDETTARLAYHNSPLTPLPVPLVGADLRNLTAGMMFTMPQPVAGTSFVTAADYTNRWHRLLELVEVPDRWHTMGASVDAGLVNADPTNSNTPAGMFRSPGKLQLNMLRSPFVLGGLLDDMDVAPLGASGAASYPYLPDTVQRAGASYNTTRDWWFDFLRSRDGIDPTNNSWVIPGLPPQYHTTSLAQIGGSRPFLPAQPSLNGGDSLNDTIYRRLPADVAGGYTDPRGLFEVGSRNIDTDSMTPDPVDSIDGEVKYRMLGKVANHTTLRSNTFFVFVQIDFFEAAEKTNGSTGGLYYKLGAKRADPSLRGFFVIDRSKAIEMVKPQHLPNLSNNGYSFDQSFNFDSLILHRRILQ